MKKRIVLLVLSIIFLIISLTLFISNIEYYNEDGWKGLDTDRDYLILLITSIFVLVMSILNYKKVYSKEVKYTGYACISLNVLYGFYGMIKVLSKGVGEIYSGNPFVINIDNMVMYSIWFVISLVAILILYNINKKRSLVL